MTISAVYCSRMVCRVRAKLVMLFLSVITTKCSGVPELWVSRLTEIFVQTIYLSILDCQKVLQLVN